MSYHRHTDLRHLIDTKNVDLNKLSGANTSEIVELLQSQLKSVEIIRTHGKGYSTSYHIAIIEALAAEQIALVKGEDYQWADEFFEIEKAHCENPHVHITGISAHL